MRSKQWTLLVGVAAAFVATELGAQVRGGERNTANLVGPPPVGVEIVSDWLGAVALRWQTGGAGTVSYTVERWKRDDVRCCSLVVNDLTNPPTIWGKVQLPGWRDVPLPVPGSYIYRVTNVYADGKRGSTELSYTRPAPSNPSKLTATARIQGNYGSNIQDVVVDFEWTPVHGASYYILRGPGTGDNGIRFDTAIESPVAAGVVGGPPQERHTTRYTTPLNVVPPGLQTWSVAAYFLPTSMGLAMGNTSASINVPAKP